MSTSTFWRKGKTQNQELLGPACPCRGRAVCSQEFMATDQAFVCSLAADQGRTLLLGQKPGWGWKGLELQLSERSGDTETGLAPGGWEPGCSIRMSTVQVTLSTASLGAPSAVFDLVHSEVWVHPVLAPKEIEFSGSVLWGGNTTPGQHLLFAGRVT